VSGRALAGAAAAVAALAVVAPTIAIGLVGLALLGVILWQHSEVLLQWRVLVGSILVLVLAVPIRRYNVPGTLPFELEPYRLAVIVVVFAWVLALLVEEGTTARRTGFDAPIAVFSLALLASVGANVGRITSQGLEEEVMKRLTYFASFIIIVYVIASVMRDRRATDAIIKILVAGGAVVAFCAVVESRTGFNPFDHLERFVPGLHFRPDGLSFTDLRGGRLRVRASAQHPIALGAALVLLVPLGVYLGSRLRSHVWWLATGVLIIGAMATVSRTAMIMLLTEMIILVFVKPDATRRLWPLAVPVLLCVQLAAPGTITGFKSAFFPSGGLISEQKAGAGTYGSGRIADLEPGIREWSHTPLFGQGFGTRITERADPKWNGFILDNEWLGMLLSTGAFGVLALLWLFGRAVRRLGRRSRLSGDDDSWLAGALAAAIGAFAVGMFTYDAFSFVQVTFLAFGLLGLAGAVLGRTPAVHGPVAPTR
jgi:hypothetical protein